VRETHENALPVLLVAAMERLIQYGVAQQARYACLARYTPIQHWVQVLRHLPSYPVGGNVITRARRRFTTLEAWSGARLGVLITICDDEFAKCRCSP
jgi:hypothetical protein